MCPKHSNLICGAFQETRISTIGLYHFPWGTLGFPHLTEFHLQENMDTEPKPGLVFFCLNGPFWKDIALKHCAACAPLGPPPWWHSEWTWVDVSRLVITSKSFFGPKPSCKLGQNLLGTDMKLPWTSMEVLLKVVRIKDMPIMNSTPVLLETYLRTMRPIYHNPWGSFNDPKNQVMSSRSSEKCQWTVGVGPPSSYFELPQNEVSRILVLEDAWS